MAPGQNGRHFADDIFKRIFLNVKICILIKISLKFFPRGPIDNDNSIGLDNSLVPNWRQAIIWTNADPIHWRMYAALVNIVYICWIKSCEKKRFAPCALTNHTIVQPIIGFKAMSTPHTKKINICFEFQVSTHQIGQPLWISKDHSTSKCKNGNAGNLLMGVPLTHFFFNFLIKYAAN